MRFKDNIIFSTVQYPIFIKKTRRLPSFLYPLCFLPAEIPLTASPVHPLDFPASISTWFLTNNSDKHIINAPVPISSHSIFTMSASGPNISIPIGIMEVEIIPITPKTLPK